MSTLLSIVPVTRSSLVLSPSSKSSRAYTVPLTGNWSLPSGNAGSPSEGRTSSTPLQMLVSVGSSNGASVGVHPESSKSGCSQSVGGDSASGSQTAGFSLGRHSHPEDPYGTTTGGVTAFDSAPGPVPTPFVAVTVNV